MRFVDHSSVVPPDGWEERAREALREAQASGDDVRITVIKQKASVWKEVKSCLEVLSNKKCWYCESKQYRSDNPIDHFRPKGRVSECPEMICGYWWLAFQINNYRYSCTYCNSRRIDYKTGVAGGKHDHFPLYDETARAKAPGDDLATEQPLLLDPCEPDDPAHLWYDEDGKTRPNPSICTLEDGFPAQRVKKTIQLLNLDHMDIVEQRLLLCRWVRRKVAEADEHLADYNQGNPAAKRAFKNIAVELGDSMAGEAELSATARCMLKGLRGSSPTAEAVLQMA